MLLEGKVALVTGGGRGIGKAIALTFAREGAELFITSRSEGELRKSADEIAAVGHEVAYRTADISLVQTAGELVRRVVDRFGHIDVLVNNAAIANPKSVVETPLEEWELVMNTNLRSVFLLTKEALKHMIPRGSGRIINIASGSGLRGLANDAAYAASKAGVIALTYSLAGELFDKGIRANVICPGPIRTQQLADSANKDFVLRKGQVMLEPDDVAGTALFLASSLSGDMSGQSISVRTTNRW